MKRSFKFVLTELAKRPDTFISAHSLPDGNGRAGGASGMKLKEMREAGVVEYGRNDGHSHYGYRITELGLEELAKANISEPENQEKSIGPR